VHGVAQFKSFGQKNPMRLLRWFIAVILSLVLAVVCFSKLPHLRTSIPGKISRFFLGEPGATQDVNDAADQIESAGWAGELTGWADRLMSEYGPIKDKLPKTFMGADLIPISHLPSQYRHLGGMFSGLGIEPELGLRPADRDHPAQVVIDWAHMRHSIIIFSEPPKNLPAGFYVRKVNDRIYVVANES